MNVVWDNDDKTSGELYVSDPIGNNLLFAMPDGKIKVQQAWFTMPSKKGV